MTIPQSLQNDSATGVLEIVWDDDTKQSLDNFELRNHCLCAECKNRHQNGDNMTAPQQTVITDIRLVGSYAAQLIFSDGHDRGIFPWTYLKAIRPREEANHD
jgi:DUF971 family protein